MASKFIKGLTEKLTMLVDDWFVIQPDAEESIAYKIKRSNVPTNLANGSGTTANGNSVDWHGLLTRIATQLDIDRDTTLTFLGTDADDFNKILWHNDAIELINIADALAGDVANNMSVIAYNEFETFGLPGILLRTISRDFSTGSTFVPGRDGVIRVGAPAIAASTAFSHMKFLHDYSAKWDALSAALKARMIPDFQYIGSVRQRSAPTIAATVLDINFVDKFDYKTTAEVAATADFSITLSNTTNAQIATIDLFITNTVIITLPANSIMEEDDTRWNSGTLQLTIPGAAGSSIELSLNKVGTKLKWIASQIFS